MRQKYICEVCGEEFNTSQQCTRHEKNCNPLSEHYCYKCGKKESWKIKDQDAWVKEEAWHRFNNGRAGYGSRLDGSDIEFELCDNCLYHYVNSFEKPDLIHNSGSNCYYDDCEDELE